MLLSALLVLPLALQIRVEVNRDTSDRQRRAPVVEDSVERRRSEPRRIPVTEQHLRTAFRNPAARTLLERARAARLSQDSALISYDATTYMRISVGLGFSKIGRDRLLFRHENATRVRWHRDIGAWIDVTGARTHLPFDEADAEAEGADFDGDITPVPYYPGQESLLGMFGSDRVEEQVNDREIVHPLAAGAEAYYTYAAGDSVVFRLPDGRSVRLRELDVRPRESRWNVAIGTLWFDAETGQLVRAAYRLAVPMDIWEVAKEDDPNADEDVPAAVKPLINPLRAELRAIAIEYGLHQGRFWLPRLRSLEAFAQASFARVPVRFDQRFRYSSVNALDSLPEIRIPVPASPPDSLSEEEREQWRDSVRAERRKARQAVADSIRQGLREPTPRCDSSGVRTVTRRHSDVGLNVAVRIPCDLQALRTSPDLPPSIYDEGEEVFGDADRDALIAEALSLGAQPPLAIGMIRPTIDWGLAYTRYNRVEGLSSGALAEQRLGAGYTAALLGRIGLADLEPNVELSLYRTNLRTTARLGAYNRLVSASDWGNPLSFGSSVSALLFGRDEGFYYRTSGLEMQWTREGGGGSARWDWRLFAERQRTATPETELTLGAAFIPNIVARTAQYAGVAGRVRHSYGLNPDGFRLFTDARVEGAASDSANAVYGRGALDLTMTLGLGPVTTAITAAAGTSTGDVPPQRLWYLGGAYTVRGQRPDTAIAGNAFWLGRLELGKPVSAARPVIFGDIGWTGDRASWQDVVRPMSGVGVGLSILDGLIRGDLSRGIYPRRQFRFDLYLEARF